MKSTPEDAMILMKVGLILYSNQQQYYTKNSFDKTIFPKTEKSKVKLVFAYPS